MRYSMDGSRIIGSEKNITRNARERIEKLGINCTSFMVAYKTINKAKERGEKITEEYVTRTAEAFSLTFDQYRIAKGYYEDLLCDNKVIITTPSPKLTGSLPSFMTGAKGQSKIHEVTARMLLTKCAADVLQKIDAEYEHASCEITQDILKEVELSRDDQSKVIAAIDLANKVKKEKSSILSVTNSAFESTSDDISFRMLMDEFRQKIQGEILREDQPKAMTGVDLDFSKKSIDAVNDLLGIAQERNRRLQPSDIVNDLGFVKDNPVVSKFLSDVYLLSQRDDEGDKLKKLDDFTDKFVIKMNPVVAHPSMRIAKPANDDRAHHRHV